MRLPLLSTTACASPTTSAVSVIAVLPAILLFFRALRSPFIGNSRSNSAVCG